MVQRFIVVSFYTEGTGYEAESKRLVRSLDAHGIEHDVCPLPNLGSWVKNCAMKAGFIERKLWEHNGRPLVWLDADAEVCRPLDLFDEAPFEFAIRQRHTPAGSRYGPWQSGTMYFRFCDRTLGLVKLWKELGDDHPKLLDQVTIHDAWGLLDDPPETLFLPWSYTCVINARGRPKDPHVLHHQASRHLKTSV